MNARIEPNARIEQSGDNLPHYYTPVWKRKVWSERIEIALKHKITDYRSVDKIINYIIDNEDEDGNCKDISRFNINSFSNTMTNYHIKEPDDGEIFAVQQTTRFPKKFVKSKIIPYIQSLALNLPHYMRNIPLRLLKTGTNGRIILTRMQVAALLAGAFFGIFEADGDDGRGGGDGDSGGESRGDGAASAAGASTSSSSFTKFHMLDVFNRCNLFALDCILYYFGRIMNETPRGSIIIKRRCINEPPMWHSAETPISPVHIFNEGDLMDSELPIIIGNTSELPTGDTLFGGSSSEEIMMLSHPELLVVALLCERLGITDAIGVMGAERFVEHKGFGADVKFVGGYQDAAPRASDGTITRSIVLINATTVVNDYTEYTKEFHGDLNKALCGMNIMMPRGLLLPIATGLWGSHVHGELGCNKQLKFLQQLLAASYLGVKLHYYTHDQFDLSDGFLSKVINFLHMIKRNDLTVADLYKKYGNVQKSIQRDVLNSYNDIDVRSLDLFDKIINQ